MAEAVPSAEEICQNKDLSLRLYKVLEYIGFTVVRDGVIRATAATETILVSAAVNRNFSIHIFGSRYEGTTTREMVSDMDMVLIYKNVPIITHSTDCTSPNGWLLEPDTHPGYVKLQWIGQRPVDNRHPIYFKIVSDKNNSVYLVFNHDHKDVHGPCSSRNGPAIRMKFPDHDREIDFVIALKGHSWPASAVEWLTRRREHGWPSPSTIDKLRNVPFLLLPVGHPHCEEREKQFRLSFSFHERVLVTEFNSVQLKCYVLLKLIKNDIICHSIKEETLTSYHCKTCMFYCIENTARDFWAPDSLASCLLMCLRQLSSWVHEKCCPNYFILGENMFDRIQSNELMIKLEICFFCILYFFNLEQLIQTLK